MFSISSSEIPKVPTMGTWQRETERVRQKREREKREQREGEDREALDEGDGKFRECRPIFNSCCQATSEQQGRKGWTAGEGDHTG